VLVRAGHDLGERDLALYASLDAREPARLVPEGSVLDVREQSEVDGKKWIRVRWQPAGETAAVDGWVLRANVERRAAATAARRAAAHEVEVEFTEGDGKRLGMELEWVDLGGDHHLLLTRVREGSAAAREGLQNGLYLHTINKATPQELGDAAAQHLAHARPLRLRFGSRPRQQRTRTRTHNPSPCDRRLAQQRSPSPFASQTVYGGTGDEVGSSSTGFFSQLLSLATCAVAGGDTPTQTWDVEDVVSRWARTTDTADVTRPVRGATSAQIARVGLPYDRVPEATGRRLIARKERGNAGNLVKIDPANFLLSCGAGSPEAELGRTEAESTHYRDDSQRDSRLLESFSSDFADDVSSRQESGYLNRLAPAAATRSGGYQETKIGGETSGKQERKEKAEVEHAYMEKIRAEQQLQKLLETEMSEMPPVVASYTEKIQAEQQVQKLLEIEMSEMPPVVASYTEKIQAAQQLQKLLEEEFAQISLRSSAPQPPEVSTQDDQHHNRRKPQVLPPQKPR
jgi:hypothetical protein